MIFCIVAAVVVIELGMHDVRLAMNARIIRGNYEGLMTAEACRDMLPYRQEGCYTLLHSRVTPSGY